MRNIKRPVDAKNKLGIVIKTHDIPGYFDEDIIFLLNFWTRYKKYGNPWPVGWTDWPRWAIESIETIDETLRILNGS